jgi:hypothetical protein
MARYPPPLVSFFPKPDKPEPKKLILLKILVHCAKNRLVRAWCPLIVELIAGGTRRVKSSFRVQRTFRSGTSASAVNSAGKSERTTKASTAATKARPMMSFQWLTRASIYGRECIESSKEGALFEVVDKFSVISILPFLI